MTLGEKCAKEANESLSCAARDVGITVILRKYWSRGHFGFLGGLDLFMQFVKQIRLVFLFYTGWLKFFHLQSK